MQSYARGEVVVVVDCRDVERTADFWTEVLGYRRAGERSGPFLSLTPSSGNGFELLLQQVPEGKAGKNRLHLDLRTPDLTAEVQRVRAAGAVLLTSTPLTEKGWRWQVLADPEGNEFCVLERADVGGASAMGTT